MALQSKVAGGAPAAAAGRPPGLLLLHCLSNPLHKQSCSFQTLAGDAYHAAEQACPYEVMSCQHQMLQHSVYCQAPWMQLVAAEPLAVVWSLWHAGFETETGQMVLSLQMGSQKAGGGPYGGSPATSARSYQHQLRGLLQAAVGAALCGRAGAAGTQFWMADAGAVAAMQLVAAARSAALASAVSAPCHVPGAAVSASCCVSAVRGAVHAAVYGRGAAAAAALHADALHAAAAAAYGHAERDGTAAAAACSAVTAVQNECSAAVPHQLHAV